jgi:hydroxyethylthiazole kinase-like uncharacterized protein yjeF
MERCETILTAGQALTRRQVRQFDQRAIGQWHVPGIVLMENAGRNCAHAICEFLGSLAGKKVAVVAGPGNNGGDGFVIARHLSVRGCGLAVFLVGDTDKMTADAAVNCEILRQLHFDICPRQGDAVGTLARELTHFDLCIDALGGTGIVGPLRGDIATAVAQINAAARPVVAVDIPTGLDCDTGEAHAPTVRAAMTVTMVARKVGFNTPCAGQYTGTVVVVDIGVPFTPVE